MCSKCLFRQSLPSALRFHRFGTAVAAMFRACLKPLLLSRKTATMPHTIVPLSSYISSDRQERYRRPLSKRPTRHRPARMLSSNAICLQFNCTGRFPVAPPLPVDARFLTAVMFAAGKTPPRRCEHDCAKTPTPLALPWYTVVTVPSPKPENPFRYRTALPDRSRRPATAARHAKNRHGVAVRIKPTNR